MMGKAVVKPERASGMGSESPLARDAAYLGLSVMVASRAKA
jgi:hypothetical protein